METHFYLQLMYNVLYCWFLLVQSFFETLQYCDEWRKFTSVIQSYIVLTPGGVPDFPHVRNSLIDCMTSLQILNKNYPIVAIYYCLSLFAVILSIGRL